MGNSVKGQREERDTTYRGSRKYDTSNFVNEMIARQNERANFEETRHRIQVGDEEINHFGRKNYHEYNEALPLQKTTGSNTSADVKVTRNPKGFAKLHNKETNKRHKQNINQKQLSKNTYEKDVSKNLKRSTQSLPNALAQKCPSVIRNRAKSDQAPRSYVKRLNQPTLGILHENETNSDNDNELVKQESENPVTDTELKPGADKDKKISVLNSNIGKDEQSARTIISMHGGIDNTTKPGNKTHINQKGKYMPKKSLTDGALNETNKIKYNKNRTQSDQVNINISESHDSERIAEQNMHVLASGTNQMKAENTECSIDIDGSLAESSSLRSTVLDSSLFKSESSVITHTSPDLPKPKDTYSENKRRLKQSLMELYRPEDMINKAFPVSISDTDNAVMNRYFQPWMTVKQRVMSEEDLDDFAEYTNPDDVDLNDYELEVNVENIHDIFHHDGRGIKHVYIEGASGTGKTLFCKHIIRQWHRQHQKDNRACNVDDTKAVEQIESPKEHRQANVNYETFEKEIQRQHTPVIKKTVDIKKSDYADPFNDMCELERFEYLFYIPLHNKKQQEHIHDLIETEYKHIFRRLTLDDKAKGTKSNPSEHSAFLKELLEKESDKILVLLDGLDQWRPIKRKYKAHIKSPVVPTRDSSKRYTILTTSTYTPKDIENVDLKVTLHGIDEETTKEIASSVVTISDKQFGKRKKLTELESELSGQNAFQYQVFPYTIQALCCIWYHSGKIGHTRCDIFSRVLELMLNRYSVVMSTIVSKTTNTESRNLSVRNKADSNFIVQLPRYFIKLENCQTWKGLVFLLAKSAWITRKQRIKVFDFSEFEMYGYTETDIKALIQVGLLTQQRYSGYSEIEHRRHVFFADERLQNFLATTYIVLLCRDKAYANMGCVDHHTENICTIVDTHLDVFDTYEHISEFSDIIVMLCGLYPSTIELVTKKIYANVSRDKHILEYRKNLDSDSTEKVLEVQELVLNCADESLFVNTDSITVHLGDLCFWNFETGYLKYIVPTEVRSLSIDTSKDHKGTSGISEFIHHTRIFDSLQKLVINDEESKLTLQDIDSLYFLSGRCAGTLNVISYVFNIINRIVYQRITLDLDKLLPQMHALSELELGHIKLRHDKFSKLADLLSRMTYLRTLKLTDITCEMKNCDNEDHRMDFREYENLEHIDIDGMELAVIGINHTRISRCVIGNMPQGPEIQTFASLKKAKHLKQFTQRVRKRPPFVSQTLISTLNTWDLLETLHLDGVNFDDNALLIRSNLTRLSKVRLVDISMTLHAWCQFVDSLSALKQSITIVTRDIQITPINDDVTRDTLRRPIDAETRAHLLATEYELKQALEYVKGNASAFKVVFHMRNMFDFMKM